MVPPSAISNLPRWLRRAPVKAPFLVAEEFAFEEGFRQRGAVDFHERLVEARGDDSWMARATSSLPVPDSPWMSTVVRVGATCAMRAWVSRKVWLPPTMRCRSSSSALSREVLAAQSRRLPGRGRR
jgi:hypothetical protein